MLEDGRLLLDEVGDTGEAVTRAAIDLDADEPAPGVRGSSPAVRAGARATAAAALLVIIAALVGPALGPPVPSRSAPVPATATSAAPVDGETFRDPSTGAIVVEYAPRG